MAKKTLAEQIAERRKEMEDKNINGKTAHIATVLGNRTEWKKDGCEVVTWRFENKRFWIEDYSIECGGNDGTMGGFHRKVKYNGKRVFYMAGGGEESFIPGEWEKEFNKLYSKARKRYGELEEAKAKLTEWRKEERERKERIKWGL
ncbi:MAG: hypothetical protein HYT64_02000 [Candidatus Yanofskybacteria bacterium]|nr:hypothetical protein [Candidatus Yanofskybacteria bacterium]